jgi:hypothetical protein
MKMKDKLEFTEAVEALKNEEERQHVSEESSTAHANAAERFLKKGCFSCGAHDHIKYNCPLHSDKKHCDKCHRIGHAAQECRSSEQSAMTATVVQDCGSEGQIQHAY